MLWGSSHFQYCFGHHETDGWGIMLRFAVLCCMYVFSRTGKRPTISDVSEFKYKLFSWYHFQILQIYVRMWQVYTIYLKCVDKKPRDNGLYFTPNIQHEFYLLRPKSTLKQGNKMSNTYEYGYGTFCYTYYIYSTYTR